MVVSQLHVKGIMSAPTKADAVLIIDSYAVLALPISSKFLQPVPRRRSQVCQVYGRVQHGQFAAGDCCGRAPSGPAGLPNFRRLLIGESLNHLLYDTEQRY
jgi:hypothetical protein